jgi:hypothetical protein
MRVFIGGMQRYLHLLLKDDRYTAKTPQEVSGLRLLYSIYKVILL